MQSVGGLKTTLPWGLARRASVFLKAVTQTPPRLGRLAATILMCALSATQAGATVITSGNVTVEGWAGPGEFNLASDTFTASGRFPPGSGYWPTLLGPFEVGSDVSVNGTQVGNDLGWAVVTIGSETYNVSISDLNGQKQSWLTFVGPSITIGRGAGIYESTFAFSGSLCGTVVSGPTPHPCVVDLPNLVGHGTVLLDVVFDSTMPFGPAYRVDTAVYSFSAVPEPTTFVLLLLGSASLSVVGLGTRRRRPRSDP